MPLRIFPKDQGVYDTKDDNSRYLTYTSAVPNAAATKEELLQARLIQNLRRKEELARESYSTNHKATTVAGFMDYDPKVAARAAFKLSTKASMRRENSWFQM